jgi:hypothetical protein
MPELHLTLTVLKDVFAVCRLDPAANIPEWVRHGELTSITRTPTELSIVCSQSLAPANIVCERDWKCMQIAGPLGFTQVGILSSMLAPLANGNISIFSISSYETDYILVKEKDLESAIAILSHEGHWISRS